jgi:hypothetical protein
MCREKGVVEMITRHSSGGLSVVHFFGGQYFMLYKEPKVVGRLSLHTKTQPHSYIFEHGT